jgi:hypothetical protein
MKKFLLSVFLVILCFFAATPALADSYTCNTPSSNTTINTPSKPSVDKGWYLLSGLSESCFRCGQCTLCDFVRLFINTSNRLVALSGIVALVIMIYGGFLWLTSAGSSEMINKGKAAILNTFIALIVILSAWMIVNTSINILMGSSLNNNAKVLGSFWSAPAVCADSK